MKVEITEATMINTRVSNQMVPCLKLTVTVDNDYPYKKITTYWTEEQLLAIHKAILDYFTTPHTKTCAKGHPLIEGGYYRWNDRKVCKICKAEYNKKQYMKKHAHTLRGKNNGYREQGKDDL